MFEIVSFYSNIDDVGRYHETIEVIDTASNLEEANTMVREYEMAFGNEFRVDFRRVQIIKKAAYQYYIANRIRIYDLCKKTWRSEQTFVYLGK